MIVSLAHAREEAIPGKTVISFQLSDYVPQDNFYRKLKEVVDFSFLYKRTSAIRTCGVPRQPLKEMSRPKIGLQVIV
jgi:hypothetical protein